MKEYKHTVETPRGKFDIYFRSNGSEIDINDIFSHEDGSKVKLDDQSIREIKNILIKLIKKGYISGIDPIEG